MSGDSFSMGADEALRVVKSMQGHEREQLRQSGRRKLDELRALKAQAQQFIHAHRAAAKQQGAFSASADGLTSSSIYNSDPAAAALSLARRNSEQAPALQQVQQPQSSPFVDAIQATNPAQPSTCAVSPAQQPDQPLQHDPLLQHSSSSSAVAAAAAAVAAGAAAVAANASARATVATTGTPPAPAASAAPAAGPDDSPVALQLLQSLQRQQSLHKQQSLHRQQSLQQQQLQQQQSLQRGQSGSVAASVEMPAQDPMVEMLLQQVEALMSDKQQLSVRVNALQLENDQLVELVGHLHEALDTQVELQEQQQLGSPRGLPTLQECSEGLEDMGDYVTCDVSTPISLRDGVMCDPGFECDPMSQSNSPTSTAAAATASLDAAPSLDGAAAAVLQRQDSHSKVAEWLDPTNSSSSSGGRALPLRKSWQEWQQELPLEPMSSGGSSSSSLALALPDM